MFTAKWPLKEKDFCSFPNTFAGNSPKTKLLQVLLQVCFCPVKSHLILRLSNVKCYGQNLGI